MKVFPLAPLRALTLVFVLLTFSQSLSAIEITDTVVVGDKEWAQVTLFTELSWNDMNAVCPLGVCGAGTLNGFDMDGWTWASRAEVGDNLFAPFPFTMHPGGLFENALDTDQLTPWVAATGFDLTQPGLLDPFGFVVSGIGGFNRDDLGPDIGAFSFAQLIDDTGAFSSKFSTLPPGFHPSRDETSTMGGWFYRAAAVPLPSVAPVLFLSLVGLMRYFRKARA